MPSAPAQDQIARRNVMVLVAAQALIGAQMPILFTIGGLAGSALSPNPCLATLPITATVLGSTLAATPLSALMQRFGRAVGFTLGTLGGMTGAALGAAGLYYGSFLLFVLGALCSGFYMSAQGFYRFAAADSASPAFRPRAISFVMAGGLCSALLGPQLVKLTAEAFVIPFLGSYLAVIALNLLGLPLFALLRIPRPERRAEDSPAPRSRMALLKNPDIAVAMICGAVSYALMNLVMTSTPLAMVGCGFATASAADVVSAHVLAMYAPSFFTGHVIARIGATRTVAVGLALLALAGGVALSGVALTNFFGALVLLGIGWNFGFIGATAMLTAAQRPEERGRLQGLNDFIVFGGVTFASLASGGLMNCAGGTAQSGWSAVNLAMLPFLALAGAALIYLSLRPRRENL